jgi:phage terminase large subunit
MDFWTAMMHGCRRAMLVWHRRAGKDLAAFNWAIMDMVALHPGGQWWHVWPTYEQGRKGFWDGADNTGRRYLDYIPPQLIKRRRDDMMMVELVNGSVYRIVGAEDPDRLVGANPVGLIMTEFSLQNPAAWDYLRPILAANDGTAIFPFTPRGRNHAHELMLNVRKDPNWIVDIKPIDVTKALPPSMLDEERAAGMSEELIQQEYYCSFNAPMSGSYYGPPMDAAMREGRIGRVPYDPNLGVETWWDIGISDETAIWFVQKHGSEIRLVDYEEASGKSLADWVKVIKDKPYHYFAHIGPHDLAAREMSTGKTRQEFALENGLRFEIAPKLGVDEGIDIVRRALPRCWFDEDKCYRGIEALKTYRKVWDAQRQAFAPKPYHDWSSHGCDAVRVGLTASRPERKLPRKPSYKRADPYAAARRRAS